MAEPLLLSVFGMFASPFITKLMTDSMLYLGSDVNKDLKDLETTILPQLELTILATKGMHPDQIEPLTVWLADLKYACIEATRILNMVRHNGRQPALLAWWRNDKKKKLLKQLKDLKEVAAKAKDVHDLLPLPSYSRPITSWQRTDEVFGRDVDRDKIIDDFLLVDQRGSNSSYNYSVFCVVTDMRGAGKTTLAQYVYSDSRVKSHFALRMWLCLSENLNITKVTKEMIECVTQKECPEFNNSGVLQHMLQHELSKISGNIMVILDDVFFCGGADEQPWGSLFGPFKDFKGGMCKIVVSSRAKWLPRTLRGKFIQWEDITPPYFQSFLRYHAIDDLQINNQQLVDELSNIVNQIAQKMSEMRIQPLEAEFVGNRLYNQPEIRFWQDALQVVEEFVTARTTYRWSIL